MSEPKTLSLEKGEAILVSVKQSPGWTGEALIWVDSTGRMCVEINNANADPLKRLLTTWWCGTAVVFHHGGFRRQVDGIAPLRG